MAAARHRRFALFLTTAGALAGCAGNGNAGPDLGDNGELRLGRVHVLVEPADTIELDGWAHLAEITARFAYFRGLDEDFVRAHIDMPVLADDVLRHGQCVATDQLTASDSHREVDDHELVLLDAGNLHVDVAGTHFEVPVSLVPDLLPYMSGVEYVWLGDVTAEPALPLPADPPPVVSVRAEGSQTDELPGFSISGRIPSRIGLDVSLSRLDEGFLVAHWQPDTSLTASSNLVLRVTALGVGETAGSDVTCVFADVGSARIDLGVLRLQGLPIIGDGVRVTASRLERRPFGTGEFEQSELLVEMRESATATW